MQTAAAVDYRGTAQWDLVVWSLPPLPLQIEAPVNNNNNNNDSRCRFQRQHLR